MHINYTRPGRAHLIVQPLTPRLYATLWLFKRRFHWMVM